MNWIKSLLALACTVSFLSTLCADEDIDLTNISTESIIPENVPPKPPKRSPFSGSGEFDYVSPTKIRKGFFKGDELKFAEAEVEVGLVYYYCPKYTEAASLALSYTETLLDWEQNVWFNQTNFHTVTLSFNGVSKRICSWLWRGQFSINMDTDELNADYTSYDLILWGRYDYCPHIGVHIGLIGQTGLYMERVYPIFGVDWKISKKWKLNLIFPFNISLEYYLAPRWTILLASRNFDSRHRAERSHYERSYSKKSREPVWRYQNIGAELAVKYEGTKATVSLHVGSTLGGQLRIANHHNHHPHHYKLRGSPYAGGDVSIYF